jgi:hypothetical protein
MSSDPSRFEWEVETSHNTLVEVEGDNFEGKCLVVIRRNQL